MKKVLLCLAVVTLLVTHTAHADRHTARNDATVTRIGDYTMLAIPISAILYTVAIQDWQGARQWSLAIGSTAVTTEVLKFVTNEERPYQDSGVDGRTFPSGHTSFAFSGAAYWQMRYGWYIGAPMYAAAAYVGYSRNYARMHNWLDIGTAAAIGIGFNYLFTTRYIPDNVNLSVEPTDGGAMLRFHTTF
ncbi:MAG: phosphatase PAP2 family protein [Alphaproteobacteria bacterium]|nr:phosphatase PAP2 family protein [Alphaproteobacteria bacterium]